MEKQQAPLKIEFTGKNSEEFLESIDSRKCFITGHDEGAESVILVNGEAVLGTVKIVDVVVENDGFEYSFPISSEAMELLKGLVKVVNSVNSIMGVSRNSGLVKSITE